MGVRPNIVIGLVGLAVFLTTGSFIASNWGPMTDQHRFVSVVSVATKTYSTQAPSPIATGQERTVTYPVTMHNVSRLNELRVTWDEGTLLPGQTPHTVTVILTDARGLEVARASGQGGQAGLTLSKDILEVPKGSTFKARGSGASEFAGLYPDHTESVGSWLVKIRAERPSGSGPNSVSPIVSLRLDAYTVFYEKADLEAMK